MKREQIDEIFYSDTTVFAQPFKDDSGYVNLTRYFPEMPKTLCALEEIDYIFYPTFEDCMYAFSFCTKKDVELVAKEKTLRKYHGEDLIFEIGMMWQENFVTAAKEYLKKIELEEATANMGINSPSRRM